MIVILNCQKCDDQCLKGYKFLGSFVHIVLIAPIFIIFLIGDSARVHLNIQNYLQPSGKESLLKHLHFFSVSFMADLRSARPTTKLQNL